MKISVKNILSVVALVAVSAFVNQAKAQQLTDKNLKQNVAPVANSLAVVNQLEPVSYQYNRDEFKKLNLPEGQQYGFATENIKQVLPAAIKNESYWYTAGKNDQRAITTSKADLEVIVPLLVGAIKDQQAQIEALKKELQSLKQQK